MVEIILKCISLPKDPEFFMGMDFLEVLRRMEVFAGRFLTVTPSLKIRFKY